MARFTKLSRPSQENDTQVFRIFRMIGTGPLPPCSIRTSQLTSKQSFSSLSQHIGTLFIFRPVSIVPRQFEFDFQTLQGPDPRTTLPANSRASLRSLPALVLSRPVSKAAATKARVPSSSSLPVTRLAAAVSRRPGPLRQAAAALAFCPGLTHQQIRG